MSDIISNSSSPLPVTVGISGAVAMVGISRAQIYRLVGAGKINMVKSGRRSLIVVSSLTDYVQGLPGANIRLPT